MNLRISPKRLKLQQTNSSITIITAAATVLTIFALISSRSLLSQASYQRKVINAKRQTVKQLKANLDAAKTLITQYRVFEGQDPNVLGGAKAGQGPLDGNNSKIVLDALPSTYDFPALTSSIEKIFSTERISSPIISGTDNESVDNATTATKPTPVTMNFTISGETNYNGAKTLVGDLEKSIRPFDIVSLTLTGSESVMKVGLSVNTYYQPSKSLTLTDTVVTDEKSK